MIAFSATNHEACIKYAHTHKLAQDRKAQFHHLSLYIQDNPISSITLSMHDSIARIDDVSTLPEFQGKGYAIHLINYALSEANRLGAIYCFLEASESGLSIYKKLGFKSLFRSNFYSKQ